MKGLLTLIFSIFGLLLSYHSYSDTLISKDQFSRHLQTLSSNEFEGRAPFTLGEKKTLDYLTDQSTKLGLEPGNGDSYLQAVPLASIKVKTRPEFKVGRQILDYKRDFMLQAGEPVAKTELENTEMVFVGYGINAPEYGWNDYKNVDVKNKIVVLLVNDPGYPTLDSQLFTGKAMTYYGRWTYKFEEAARQGAAGAIIIHETQPAGYPWAVIQNSTFERFTLVHKDNNEPTLKVVGWMQQSTANSLLASNKTNLESFKEFALSQEFSPLTIKEKVNITINSQVQFSTSYNFIAKITGTEQPDEAIIYSAHWDHLGRKGLQGDRIFNGAIDNATGVAGLLELARVFKLNGKPKRSILFFSPTAEEQGLLGSEYFTRNSPYPLNKVVATLNMDGLNVFKPEKKITVFGKGQSELEDYLLKAAQTQQRGVQPDPVPETGLYYRSDHFSFAKAGVPSLLFLNIGTGGNDYVKRHYHKPSDEFNPNWPLTGAVQDLDVLFKIGQKLSGERHFPKWKDGSEFKAARDISMRQISNN